MQLKLGDNIVNVGEVEMDAPVISKHTGRELEKFSVTINVQRTYADEFETLLNGMNDGGIFSIVDDNVSKEYKMVNRSYSYSNNESPYKYTLTVEEVEKLKLDKLIINGIDVTPYEYSEEYSNGIIINAKWKISKDEKDTLNKAVDKQDYFKVIRVGICEEKIDMRFGQVLWSDDNGYIKQDVTLVEKIYDDKEKLFHGLCEPQLSNIMRMLAQTTNLNNYLLELLLEKGILTSPDIEKLKESAKQDEIKMLRMFYQVDDIDTYEK